MWAIPAPMRADDSTTENPSDPGRVTVVVISRNRRDDLLDSLPRHEGPVVLVDNGSTDGTVEVVRERLPHVHIVSLAENQGAVARNLGVDRARTPYVAFADDDSWWAEGALERAAQIFDEYPRLGLIAGQILVGTEERLDPVCADMASAPLGRAADLPGPDVLGFIACGAIVRREAFQQAGGFDPVVHFPGEEERVALDLAGLGWGLAYVPEVVAHHVPSPRRSGADERRRLITRNALLTAWMRRPWPVVARRTATAFRQGGPARAGAPAVVPRLPGALRRRRQVPDSVEELLERLETVAG
jgi:GT2 family glycosyltransferase